MKPLYNSNIGRVARPRKQERKIGYMPSKLRQEADKLGITKMSVGLMLIGLGVNVLNLSR